MSVVGKTCPPLLSVKEKEQLKIKEESQKLAILKNNGLVQKPIVMMQNYALFEIVEEKISTRKQGDITKLQPPQRL